jgi:DNA-directed RNA polymerase subunit alpha
MTMGHLDQNWPTLLRPSRIPIANPERIGRFVCEPLERDFALRLAPSLRQALLHAVSGTAIVGIHARLDGAEPAPGWSQALALNLSQVALRDADEARVITLEAPAGNIVRAAELARPRLHVVNPQQLVCVASQHLRLELWIARGYGMRLAALGHDHIPDSATPVDAFFGPVLRADCFVSELTVGAWRDCGRLVIDVETNGAMTPEEAMSAAVRALLEPSDRRFDRAA